jgi:pimeloyl-ACP methyl ester carboxylesterase
VDLYGMGRTTREAPTSAYTVRAQANLLATALNDLRVTQATIVAADWGCGVALQMAYEQPQFVRQLVLLAPRVASPWTVWHQRVAQVPYLNRASAWLVYGGGPAWAALQRYDLGGSAAAGEHLKRIRRTTHIVGTLDALVTMTQAPDDSDLPEALARIQAPTLILTAEDDLYVPLASAQALRSVLPAARIEILPKAGHQLHVTHAADVARSILALQR